MVIPCNCKGLKRGLLLFWALWLALVCTTNVTDGLKELGVLAADWPFASGNYAFMVKVTGVYSTPAWVVALLFTGVILWEGLAAFLFGRAFLASDSPAVTTAFAVSLALWSAFMLADEFFLAYPVENTHRGIFAAQLLSLLTLRLLPDEV